VYVERLVGEGGLEPPPAEPESAVLPLDDSPIAHQKYQVPRPESRTAFARHAAQPSIRGPAVSLARYAAADNNRSTLFLRPRRWMTANISGETSSPVSATRHG
jgi:hypothetical protein